jgi:hypothetical protein
MNQLLNISPLINNVKTATNKRYSSPGVVVIRIDVHPARENLINTPHIFTLG